jgi:hypothetical protein
MDAKTSNTPEDLAQLRDQIATALSSADSRAAQSIGNLQLVQQARVSRLSRTADALKKQYGSDDPQVKKAEAETTAAAAAAGQAYMLSRQFSTPVPKISPNGWALHGRVFDAQFQPVSGFTVFLVDSEKVFQRAYGFAYTDNTGYFLINYPGESQTQAGSEPETNPQLFVQIADANGQPVYLSDTAFQPVAGSITYQNIVLPSGNQPIGNPPPPIRGFAMPDGKPQKQ